MEGRAEARMQGAVEKRLSKIKAAGTGLDVMRKGLIRDLLVSHGEVSLVFRPSSRTGPEAFQMGMEIHDAVRSIHGVEQVVIHVEDYDRAPELEHRLREIASASGKAE